MKNDEINYTMIKHIPRVKFGLSNNDYCVANAIYHLSHNPDSRFPGWYYGKIETLGKMFHLSRATAYHSVQKLIKLELVQRDKDTSFLKTTTQWWQNFVKDDSMKRAEIDSNN